MLAPERYIPIGAQLEQAEAEVQVTQGLTQAGATELLPSS